LQCALALREFDGWLARAGAVVTAG